MGFNGVSRYSIRLLYSFNIALVFFGVSPLSPEVWQEVWADTQSLPAPNIVSSQQGAQGTPGAGLYTAQQLVPCTAASPTMPTVDVSAFNGFAGRLSTCSNMMVNGLSSFASQSLMSPAITGATMGSSGIAGAPSGAGGAVMGLACGAMGAVALNQPCPNLMPLPTVPQIQPPSCSVLRAGAFGKSQLSMAEQEVQQALAQVLPSQCAAACVVGKENAIKQDILCMQQAANQYRTAMQQSAQNAQNGYMAAYQNMQTCTNNLTQASADQQLKLQNIDTYQQKVTQELQQVQEFQSQLASSIPAFQTQVQQLNLVQNAFPTAENLYATAFIMNCLSQMTGPSFTCDNGKTQTNAFSYVECRLEQGLKTGKASNGMTIINQNAGTNYTAQTAGSALTTEINNLITNAPPASAGTFPSDPSQLMTYTNVMTPIQTPQQLQSYIASNFNQMITMNNGQQVSAQAFISNRFQYCQNLVNATINGANAGGAGPIGQMKLQIQQMQNDVNSTANTVFAQANQTYATATQSIGINAANLGVGGGSSCSTASPAGQLSCLQQAQSSFNTLMNGPNVPGLQPMVIAGNGFTSNLSIPCNGGMNACMTQLNNAQRNVQQTVQNMNLAQSQYPRAQVQAAQTSVNTLAQQISPISQQWNQWQQQINQALAAEGGQPIPVGASKPCVIQADDKGLPDLSGNMVTCAEGAASPPFPDPNSLSQIAATPGQQTEQAQQMMMQANQLSAALKMEKQKLAQLPTQCAEQSNKDMLKGATQFANQAANCDCEDAKMQSQFNHMDQMFERMNQMNQMDNMNLMGGGGMGGMGMMGGGMGMGGMSSMNPMMTQYGNLSAGYMQNAYPGFPSSDMYALGAGIANACGGGGTVEKNVAQEQFDSLQVQKKNLQTQLAATYKLIAQQQQIPLAQQGREQSGPTPAELAQINLALASSQNSAQKGQVAELKNEIKALNDQIAKLRAPTTTGQVENKPKNCSMVNTAVTSIRGATKAADYGGGNHSAEDAHQGQ